MNEIIRLGKLTEDSYLPTYRLLQRYISPLSFGPPPPHEGKKIRSGTVYFIEGSVAFAVTCQHCIKAFRQAKKVSPNTAIQVNNLNIRDVEERMIDEDEDLDLFTFRINPEELRRYYPDATFLPHRIHREFSDGSIVTAIGFPGQFVTKKESGDYFAGAVGIAEEISMSKLADHSFILPFNREGWVTRLNNTGTDIEDFQDYGGFSGSPVFFLDHIGVKLAGTIYQDAGGLTDGVLVRYAGYILEDGRIDRFYKHIQRVDGSV